jgi:integrase
MVRLQWLTGMRPSEVCRLVWGEIDQTRTTWLYVPSIHKTAHRRKDRVVALGPRARQLLQPFLFRPPTEPVFSPKESLRWWTEQRRGGEDRKGDTPPYDHLGDAYTTKTYADTIERACKRAGVPVWTPGLVRHNAASKGNQNLESARVLLGHSRSSTTKIYITEDVRKLMDQAERAG